MRTANLKLLNIIPVSTFLLVLISHVCLAENNPPTLESKENFLKKPLFQNNEKYETLKKEQKTAEDLKKRLIPNPPPNIPLKLAKPKQTPPNALQNIPKPNPILAPTADPAFKLSPNPLNLIPSGTRPTECSYNLYLKNYCVYADPEAQWLICSERWERCLRRYKP